jgi:hypothetical protein
VRSSPPSQDLLAALLAADQIVGTPVEHLSAISALVAEIRFAVPTPGAIRESAQAVQEWARVFSDPAECQRFGGERRVRSRYQAECKSLRHLVERLVRTG